MQSAIFARTPEAATLESTATKLAVTEAKLIFKLALYRNLAEALYSVAIFIHRRALWSRLEFKMIHNLLSFSIGSSSRHISPTCGMTTRLEPGCGYFANAVV